MTYFDQQNAKIDAGELEAEKIVVSALMINKFVMLFFVFFFLYITVFLMNVVLQWLVRPPAPV